MLLERMLWSKPLLKALCRIVLLMVKLQWKSTKRQILISAQL
jgi:hypothetical protein